MLIELLQLARNLKGQGVETSSVHRDFDTPGLSTYTTLKAVLGDDGEIVRLLPIAGDEKPGLWTLKRGNFVFFPAVRLPGPGFVQLTPDDELWKRLGSKPPIAEVRSLAERARSSAPKIDLANLRTKQADRMLRWTQGDDAQSLSQLKSFAAAFAEFTKSPEHAGLQVVEAIDRTLSTACSDEILAALTTLLVGRRKEERGKPAKVVYQMQICFDYRPAGDIGFSLYTPRMRRAVLDCLDRETDGADSNEVRIDQICALTGSAVTEFLSGPYPGWSAPPVISKSQKPFSKFSDAPCNYRYGHADSDGFRISSDTAKELVGALATITSKFGTSNSRAIKNGQFEERNKRKLEGADVLVVYPTCRTEELAFVDLFARTSSSDDDKGSTRAAKDFAEAAAPICLSLEQTINTHEVADYLVVLLIRQISEGQIQLAYSNNLPIKHFIEAIGEWNASAQNLPLGLRVPLPSKKSASGFGWFRPAVLFPEDISRLLSQQWIRSGAESTRVAGPPVGTVFDFFLRRQGVWLGIARSLLEITLARTVVLLTGCGHILHRDRSLILWRQFVSAADTGKEKRRPDYALAQTLSLIGSLLYAMNSKVNDYVNESAYLVGKLLAMMDELHRCYCIAVRKGDIPNALIGNGLLGRASESPAQALADLSERSRIYLGWAKSALPGERASDEVKIAINSARKLLRLASPLSEKLHADMALDEELSPIQKAHLFLGYLSPVLGQEERASDPASSEPANKKAHTLNAPEELAE